MKKNEIKNMSADELKTHLLELLKEQFNLRMQKGVDVSSSKSHLLQRTRRDIARVKTYLRAQEANNNE